MNIFTLLVAAVGFADGLQTKHAFKSGRLQQQQQSRLPREVLADANILPDIQPPRQPYQEIYDHLDHVAEDHELRLRPPFYPEGTSTSEITEDQLNGLPKAFSEKPDQWSNCILIRDVAEPFTVASAVVGGSSEHLHGQNRGRNLRKGRKGANDSDAAEEREAEEAVRDVEREVNAVNNGEDPEEHDEDAEGEAKDDEGGEGNELPAANKKSTPLDILLNASRQGEDIPEDHMHPYQGLHAIQGGSTVSLEVDAFANLRSISGTVQVIRNGYFANWGSKAKAPIAGFLCNDASKDGAQVLHTLLTPCVPTTLTPRGEVMEPFNSTYDVWIGNSRVSFKDHKAASKFCSEVAQSIGDDLQQAWWDTDGLPEEWPLKGAVNPSSKSFIQDTKKTREGSSWTRGQKTLLVVVMDWKAGDRSLPPMSRQDTNNPIRHYRENIFPEVARAFKEMSDSQYTLKVEFVPEVVRYTRDRRIYKRNGWPFPGLYDGARESLAGSSWGRDYSFDNYDLVYVISPQQAPVGTKGVAWVGQKGAMCNGCEAISDNFKIMVAVHELGHNLGLLHAGSHSLVYGNPFDWMGNYPDVRGLTYGLGYLYKLGWVKEDKIIQVTDRNVDDVNDAVAIHPFDYSNQRSGKLGILISLRDNPRDIYVSYRASTQLRHRGVYIVYQDKRKPDSELMDAGCHSLSQQDAFLKEGWTYMDPSNTVAVVVKKMSSAAAEVHVYRVPSPTRNVPRIRGRDLFTDGQYKCPRTCQDSDWVMSSYTCQELKTKGYCDSGSITMLGQKYSIKKELCPQSCGYCSRIQSAPQETGKDGCEDRNVKISGKSCRGAAAAGWCGYNTNSGSVGRDLCPRSCNLCPDVPRATSPTFQDPTPRRSIGLQDSSEDPLDRTTTTSTSTAASTTTAKATSTANREKGGSTSANKTESTTRPATTTKFYDDEPSTSRPLCNNDPDWIDADGDGCAAYASVVSEGVMTRKEACDYDGGRANFFCRKTCDTCSASSSTCADKTCVGAWEEKFNRCYQCSAFPRFCEFDWFKSDCPMTCGECKSDSAALVARAPSVPRELVVAEAAAVAAEEYDRNATTGTASATQNATVSQKCEDSECVDKWVDEYGKCYNCGDFSQYCTETYFRRSCPKTCGQCHNAKCEDTYSSYTCQRYVSYNWCSHHFVQQKCRLSCQLCDSPIAHNATNEPGRNDPDSNSTTKSSKSAESGAVSVGFSAVALMVVLLQ
mmetsp:Transcript_26133/g.67386  ORF Transcript_26133/g.67386 Transcript_26133/m.67386 type:complete len:1224 (+) Transcript_26133:171-3842(+)